MHGQDGLLLARTAKALALNQSKTLLPAIFFFKVLKTHKTRLSGIDKRFCCKPFPHEGAGGAIVNRIKQTADIMIHYQCHRYSQKIGYN
jgi:hypothetical protein